MQELPSIPSNDELFDIAFGVGDGPSPATAVVQRCAHCQATSLDALGYSMVCQSCGAEAFGVFTTSASGARDYETERVATHPQRNEELFGAKMMPAITLTPVAVDGDCRSCQVNAHGARASLRTKARVLGAILENHPPFASARKIIAEAKERADDLVANCTPGIGGYVSFKEKNGLTAQARLVVNELHAWARSDECNFLGLKGAFPANAPPSKFAVLLRAALAMQKLAKRASERYEGRLDRLRRFAVLGDANALCDDGDGVAILRPREAMGIKKGLVEQTVSESFLARVKRREPDLANLFAAAAASGNHAALVALGERLEWTDVAGVKRAQKVKTLCCDKPACRAAMCIGFVGFAGSGTAAESDDGGRTMDNFWKFELRFLPIVANALRAAPWSWDESKTLAVLDQRTKARYYNSKFYESRASRTVTAAFCLMQQVHPRVELDMEQHRMSLAHTVSVCSAALVHGLYLQFVDAALKFATAPAEYFVKLDNAHKRYVDHHGSGELDGALLARLIMHHQKQTGEETFTRDGVHVPPQSCDPRGGTSVDDFNAFVHATLTNANAEGHSGKARSMSLVRRREHTTDSFDETLASVRNGVLGDAGKPIADDSANPTSADLKPRNAKIQPALLDQVVASFAERFKLADDATFTTYMGRCEKLSLLFSERNAKTSDAPSAPAAVAASPALGALPPLAKRAPVPPPPPPPSDALVALAAGAFKDRRRAQSPIQPVNEASERQAAQRFDTELDIVRSSLGILRFLLLSPTTAVAILKQSLGACNAPTDGADTADVLLDTLTRCMIKKTLGKQTALLHTPHVIDFLCHVAWVAGTGRCGDGGECALAQSVAKHYNVDRRSPNSPKRKRHL
jgi:hypothetical protein